MPHAPHEDRNTHEHKSCPVQKIYLLAPRPWTSQTPKMKKFSFSLFLGYPASVLLL